MNRQDKNMLLSYMENNSIPKFYIAEDLNEFKIKTDMVYYHYFKVIDRIEYAVYSETYPYPAFLLYNNNSLLAYTIEKFSIENILSMMSESTSLIKEYEFYSEAIRVNSMLKLIERGSVKIN